MDTAGAGIEEHGSEQRLAEFYNRRAASRWDHPLAPRRVEQRERFIALLKSEGRHNVLEIGSGMGLDGLQFVRAGIHYIGVDLSEEHVRHASSKGLDVSVASARQLPFADGTFPAVWTMSTLLHIPATDIDSVLRELVRVTAPGGPIAVGLWSGEDDEVLNPEDDVEPRRFFSRRSDATVRQVFGRHGAIEDFVTWPEGAGEESGPGAGNWTQHYQFLILRTLA
ncbi:methyltransferase domain-containing protein [Pseudarthrobacter psychrotolerans]|uniref:Methyltransferase domain-containing protein n=1 Tax=Pseudarthrobacter psychrotolerans TaxID=2697569 RepID=A0A6P1NTN6_9MICC|nr:class I SAM-dependent methyltransferase [Pseudarthrobacter psychrotolerans]QHK21934.1 methyltransferase domain-containing protein [Pseudarthrobacter psychrotolerans]